MGPTQHNYALVNKLVASISNGTARGATDGSHIPQTMQGAYAYVVTINDTLIDLYEGGGKCPLQENMTSQTNITQSLPCWGDCTLFIANIKLLEKTIMN